MLYLCNLNLIYYYVFTLLKIDWTYIYILDNMNLTAGWSSPVARQAHNLKVVGSNPTSATNQ